MGEQFKFGWRPTVDGLLAHAEEHYVHVLAAYPVRPVTKFVSDGEGGSLPVTISEPQVPPRSIQLSTSIETKHLLEDLRSVFDYTAVHIARELLTQPLIKAVNSMLSTEKALFPIAATEAEWMQLVKKLPWKAAGPKTLSLLRAFQPVEDPTKNKWLRVLQNLVNENKHSSLTEFFVQPGEKPLSFRQGDRLYSVEVRSLTIPSAKLHRDETTKNPVPDAWTFFEEAFAGTRKFIDVVADTVPQLRKEGEKTGGRAV